jgi:hypothetical protein
MDLQITRFPKPLRRSLRADRMALPTVEAPPTPDIVKEPRQGDNA